ncbi:MAG: hypothetical protein IT204_21440 [Fimbriimonadaceae bacterium]|nr:hypothetical protein [Fimbriimonadaceae bacterium]
MALPEPPTTAEPPAERPLPRRLIGVAGYLQGLRPGPRARLRRLRQHPDRLPADFWALVERYAIDPCDETYWVAVVPLMVVHRHARWRPGRALAAAGVSKARIERWLRLDRERAMAEAWRLLSKLPSGLDWASFGQLLWYWDDQRRRAFARDYFLGGGVGEDKGEGA